MNLVLHPRYDEDSQLLWQAATESGWTVERRGYDDLPGSFDALYGGYIWGERIAEASGIHLASPPADYLSLLPSYLVKRSIGRVRGSDISTLQFPQFIKAEDRSITSRVYHSRDDLPSNIDPDAFYTTQEPVLWNREYRCFILGDAVVTASGYAKDGEKWRGDPCDAVQWLSGFMLIARAGLPRSVVIDVGWIENRGWAIVEANAAWCSGIYGCDPRAVLQCARI